MTTTAIPTAPINPPQAQAGKRPYAAPHLKVHGSVAQLTAANGVDGLLVSRPIGF